MKHLLSSRSWKIEVPIRDQEIRFMLRQYLGKNAGSNSIHIPSHLFWRYGPTREECELKTDKVLRRKLSTATSLYWLYQVLDRPAPGKGDVTFLVDWSGCVQCVLKTTRAEICTVGDAINDAGSWLQRFEGKHKESWEQEVFQYAHRFSPVINLRIDRSMPVVFESFEVIWTGACEYTDACTEQRESGLAFA